MIIRYKLKLTTPNAHFRPEWAYPLYSFLLNHSDAEFSTNAHLDRTTPVSQYLRKTDDRLLWTVSLLENNSIEALEQLLCSQAEFLLDKDGLQLYVEERERQVIGCVDELLATTGSDLQSDFHSLRFHTPTAFKSKGGYVCLPTVRLIVQSLLRKWNACMGADIMLSEDETDILAEGLICRRFNIHDSIYRIKGNPIHGFSGEMTLTNRLNGELREHANLLMNFAEYAGVGIKTALGMGGVETDKSFR